MNQITVGLEHLRDKAFQGTEEPFIMQLATSGKSI